MYFQKRNVIFQAVFPAFRIDNFFLLLEQKKSKNIFNFLSAVEIAVRRIAVKPFLQNKKLKQ